MTNKKFNSQNEIDEKTRSCRDVYSFINNFNKLLAKPIKSTRKNQEQSNKEYSELFKLEDKKKNKFIIWPKLLLPDDLPVDILDKFIVVTCIDKIENSFGPYSVKMLCRVQSIEQNLTNELVNSYNQDDESSGSMMSKQDNNDRKDPTDRKKLTWFNSYIICNDNYGNSDKNKNNKKQIVFCSSQIMAKLKVFVGAKLKIEKPQLGLQSSFDSFPTVKPKITEEVKYIFWETMEDIKKNTIKNTINSIKFNCTINTLIVGSIGTGKTTLLNALIEIFSHNFIFNRIIYCKTLRKKKIEAISKVLLEILRSCCRHEPAILILDDLHAMTYVDEEQNQCNKLYSDRIVEMMTELLKAFQEKYNVIVLATTVGLEELGSMVTSRGPRFFQNVEKITEMSTTDRHLMLNEIIKFKSKDLAVGSLDLKKMAEKTNGYAIQDLNDVVDKAVLKCFTRGENLRLSQSDFDEALSESIPLLLRGTDLKERNVGKTWKDVGGMQEPKRVLIEVFLWPSKYPKLLESCPLRLQRGVLLYGAPGTGKTLLAGALANKCNLNFISVKGPEILSKYVGASEEGVRNLFIQAHKTQPCLLFFDEFDSLASKRGHDSTGVTDRVVNQLLTQLDGVEAISGVWVLAATSRPDLLDPALLRPGRLDKMVFCDLPNKVT